MKKLTSLLLTALIATTLTAGCGTANTTTSTDTQTASSAEETVQENQEKETKEKFVIVDDNLSNLQLTAPNLPVYDKMTIAQRREKGLPTALPELTPYSTGKVAYLTFDDGPENVNTIAILDTLKENNAVATFYVTGAHAELHPDVLKRIYEEGHAIGNHSYDHDYDRLYPSIDGFMSEMMHTDDVIMKIIGVRPMILRAPGGTIGHFSDIYWQTIKENGYTEHDWNVSSADAAPNHPVAQDFIDNIDFGTSDGKESAIILMHCSEGHEETAKALPKIIQILKDRGYTFGVITPMTPQPW